MALGAPSRTAAGKLLPQDFEIEYSIGEGWRMPTRAEFKELAENCHMKLILTPAGLPSYVQFISKKNGAKVNFYFPKMWFKNGSTGETKNNSASEYMGFLSAQNNDYMMLAAKKMPASFRTQGQKILSQAGLSVDKVDEWPEAISKQLQRNGIYFLDNKFTWAGAPDISSGANKDMYLLIQPVYSVNDDE